MDDRTKWLRELEEAQKTARKLVAQDDFPPPWERESCVICDKKTLLWLQPENTPLCRHSCLRAYLKDPSIYDPRLLHTDPAAAALPKAKKEPVKKRRKPRSSGRWEPSEADIAEMQARISSKKD